MNKRAITTIGAAVTALFLSACDVDKTQDGKMPEVDVDVKSGQLPKYDVDAADIDVGTKEVEVTVPDVDIDVSSKKKVISVPDVDVNMEDDDPENEMEKLKDEPNNS